MPRRPDLDALLSPPLRMPARPAYTPAEWRLIERLRTPRQVQRYLRALPYNWEHTLRSFRGSVEAGRAHCLEAVLLAAAILEHHGYPPAVLDIESDDGLDHVLFLYREGGKWGTVARSRDFGLHGRPPLFRSIPALVSSYMDPYVDGTGRLNAWGVAHLDRLTTADWRLSGKSVRRVERALIEMQHFPLPMGERRFQRALRRFQAFKASGRAVTRRSQRALYGEQVDRWW